MLVSLALDNVVTPLTLGYTNIRLKTCEYSYNFTLCM